MKPAAQQRLSIEGPVGALEVVINDPERDDALAGSGHRGIALIAHPHPLHGGTLDNKVVQTLAKAFHSQGYVAVRMNFRGVGESHGTFNEGIGETDDWLRVHQAMLLRFGPLPCVLAGFSFGAFVQSRVAQHFARSGIAARLVLIAPAVGRFAVVPPSPGTLIVHGDQDDVVPLQEVFAWAKPTHAPVVVLPGAGHFFHGYLTELQSIVKRFAASDGD
ncbi:MAG: alpha/beta hydrolase [Betaproteobacteria bacterium]